jgi:hypothetical protein
LRDLIKRIALYQAYGERCIYCRAPLLFREMTVDHILPQTLLEDPIRKSQILREYGLPEYFDFESYDNWLPCHHYENREKSVTVFDKANAHYFLGIAKERSKKAASIEKKWRDAKRDDKILYELQIGLKNGRITKDQIYRVVEMKEVLYDIASPNENEPIVIAFGLKIEDVREQGIYNLELLSNYP